MDPDANWEEQQRLAEGLLRDDGFSPSSALRLAELVLALNEWLEKGGFPPEAWKRDTSKGPVG